MAMAASALNIVAEGTVEFSLWFVMIEGKML